MTIAGVLRDEIFSPNSNDLRIMQLVSENLQGQGRTILLYTEKEFLRNDIHAHIVFSMARHTATLDKLQVLESQGTLVVNPPAGVRHCHRIVITQALLRQGLSVPRNVFFDLSQEVTLPEDIPFPCWLKRADTYTLTKDDVCFIHNQAALSNHLADFIKRNIKTAVVSRHIKGDLIKFYGVSKTSFFHWHYPTLNIHGEKFGLEKLNGPVRHYPFSPDKLKADMTLLAETLQVPVYGGDCIVDNEGNCQFIDFNDWPSFSVCAEEASQAIGEYINSLIRSSVTA